MVKRGIMKKKAEILDELKDIGVDWNSNPTDAYLFDVPNGYFDTLPSQIMANIKASESETELNPTLNNALTKSTLFDVPENYFDALSNNILSKIHARDAIIEGNVQIFKSVSAENPYHLPENYFESLSRNVFDRIVSDDIVSSEEIESISPLLATLKHKNSYETPDTYFNAIDFAEKIQVKTIETKVVEHPAVKSIKWARWAAAASIILIFSVGGAKFLGTNSASVNPDQKLEQSLAKIPDAKIQEWLANNIDEIDISSLQGTASNSNRPKTVDEQRIEDIQNDLF